jgi:NAD(P)-dependent dehydrogenase (short-subunit alcohol dehydrogenase family)
MPDPDQDAGAEELARPPRADGSATGRRRYTTSKLANVRTAYALAGRLAGRGVTVNAFDPGLMPGTGLARDFGPLARLVWRTAFRALVLLPGVNTPATSGADLAHLMTAPELAGVTGAYFVRRRPEGSSFASHDARAAEALYRDSLRLIEQLTPVAG